MASNVINIEDDHPRWEEYKFERLRHPSVEDDIDKNPYPQRFDNSRNNRPRRSLVKKEGQSNVTFKGVKSKTRRYLKDLFITLLEMQWRYVILLFFGTFLAFYLAFALVYYLLAWLHGDFSNLDNPAYAPCIQNLEGMWDAFLFSIETQSTIGYGIIYAHPECGSTLPFIFLQVAAGFLFETLLFGFVFAKLSRPKHRRHTLAFSRHACILQEEGQLTLQIRVGDMRRSHLIETRVHGLLIKRHVVREKYVYPLYQHQLEFDAHEMGDRLFLLWPLVLTHRITPSSPLYTLKPDDLVFDKFEIVVFLEGYIEATGEMCQARTSYTTREILWGHRFTRLEEYDAKNDLWVMDFVRFNQVVPSPTPRVSAAELAAQTPEDMAALCQSMSHADLRRSNATIDDDDDLYNTASESNDDDDVYVVGQPIEIPFTPMSSDE
ncbi:G protein-activated inward rectifier potassium channel 3-like [Babylonia areolata]|uniref:G protein-activated inward rectifier potassium channel 3-like n=1 Tax=Babylonia areolata TaxID=304850 RepID=UPI003FD08B45